VDGNVNPEAVLLPVTVMGVVRLPSEPWQDPVTMCGPFIVAVLSASTPIVKFARSVPRLVPMGPQSHTTLPRYVPFHSSTSPLCRRVLVRGGSADAGDRDRDLVGEIERRVLPVSGLKAESVLAGRKLELGFARSVVQMHVRLILTDRCAGSDAAHVQDEVEVACPIADVPGRLERKALGLG
jgi:hypothetical protein